MMRLVLDSIPVREYSKDQNLKYLGCNSLFAKDVGLKRPEDIVGKSDEELGWLEWKEMHENCDRNIMETGVPKLHLGGRGRARGGGGRGRGGGGGPRAGRGSGGGGGGAADGGI